MGRAALGVCFDGGTDDMGEAAAHVCNTLFPMVTSAGATLSCTGVTGSLGGSRILSMLSSTSGTSTAAQRVVSAPACDRLTFVNGPGPWGISVTDAGLVGAAILATWLVGVGWRLIRAALGDHNDSSSD